MITEQVQIRAIRADWNRSVRLGVFSEKFMYKVERSAGTLYEEVQPFCDIDFKTAQTLMDDLWSCGIRPTEGSGSAGALKAVEDHLDSLRKITFHILKVGKSK